eukprot:CAMPEP_0194096520 /NCGR_PEP_ID=MMETSP0149-20130528/57383_1 /TAXON_ID=122233 /ORGANISM="Chaetoceros debilis, Strain MM31A-1" /LENGTH=392 /DNA_ID=CAMNT_0038782495 /DNA_START=79 /DNA_END=1257 /DNA_ORIENTATION=+
MASLGIKIAFTMLMLSPVSSFAAFGTIAPFRASHGIAPFQHANSPTSASAFHRSQLFAATSETDGGNSSSNSNSKSKGMTTLHFKGESVFRSDPLPYECIEDITKFLENEKEVIHNILLNGYPGGKNKVVPVDIHLDDRTIHNILLNGYPGGKNKVVPVDIHLDDRTVTDAWKKQCLAVGGEFRVDVDVDVDVENENNGIGEQKQETNGNDDTIVYQVNGGGFNMGGLSLKIEMLIGATTTTTTTTMQNENENSPETLSSSPEYQLVFIRDKRVAEVPRLLVWAYNKLTGGSSGKDEAESAITSMTRFYPVVDTEKKEVVFTSKSFLDIAVKFPSLLLKILPVSKEKAEEEGSASIMKTLVKDTEPTIPVLMECYREYLSKNENENAYAGTK